MLVCHNKQHISNDTQRHQHRILTGESAELCLPKTRNDYLNVLLLGEKLSSDYINNKLGLDAKGLILT